MSSHDVVDEIRRLTGERKVGHAGTLDPLAEGVLVVGVGRDATKRLGQFSKSEKEYMAEIVLGVTSTTDDNEGQKQKLQARDIPDDARIREVLCSFEGWIRQRPPLYSAVKVAGSRAYKLARAKKQFELPERNVWIKQIELLEYNWPRLRIRVVTGAGVYIRSLARDVGEKLGAGGYLNGLERTRVAEFKKEDAVTISRLQGG